MHVAHRVLTLALFAACTPVSAEDESLKVEAVEPPPETPPEVERLDVRSPFCMQCSRTVLQFADYRESALYTPDPNPMELAHMSPERFTPPLVGIVPFCVGETGKPIRVETPSTGDAEVDAFLRKAVTKWRFRPFVVGGVATKVCSVVEFQVSFE